MLVRPKKSAKKVHEDKAFSSASSSDRLKIHLETIDVLEQEGDEDGLLETYFKTCKDDDPEMFSELRQNVPDIQQRFDNPKSYIGHDESYHDYYKRICTLPLQYKANLKAFKRDLSNYRTRPFFLSPTSRLGTEIFNLQKTRLNISDYDFKRGLLLVFGTIPEIFLMMLYARYLKIHANYTTTQSDETEHLMHHSQKKFLTNYSTNPKIRAALFAAYEDVTMSTYGHIVISKKIFDDLDLKTSFESGAAYITKFWDNIPQIPYKNWLRISTDSATQSIHIEFESPHRIQQKFDRKFRALAQSAVPPIARESSSSSSSSSALSVSTGTMVKVEPRKIPKKRAALSHGSSGESKEISLSSESSSSLNMISQLDDHKRSSSSLPIASSEVKVSSSRTRGRFADTYEASLIPSATELARQAARAVPTPASSDASLGQKRLRQENPQESLHRASSLFQPNRTRIPKKQKTDVAIGRRI